MGKLRQRIQSKGGNNHDRRDLRRDVLEDAAAPSFSHHQTGA
jgi:hypothetical protein